MSRWYRQSLPGKGWTIMFVVMIVFTDTVALLVWLMWGRLLDESGHKLLLAPTTALVPVLCCAASLILAGFRVVRYPARNANYHSWLAQTPWIAKQRTPFGPWHPVIHDIIPLRILGVISGIHVGMFSLSKFPPGFYTWLSVNPRLLSGILSALLPTAILFCSWAFFGYGSVLNEWKRSVYVTALAIGLLIHLACRASVMISVVAAVACTIVGITIVWRRMAITLPTVTSKLLTANDATPDRRATTPAFEALSPQPFQSSVCRFWKSSRDHIWAGMVLLLVWLTIPNWKTEALIVMPLAVFLVSWIPLCAYAEKHGTHLGLAARWATRRFFVRDYDRIYLLTIAIGAAGIATLGLTATGILPTTIGGALTVVVPLMIGLLCGPEYKTW